MSPELPPNPDERRIDAMMDGSGFSRNSAEIKIGQKVVAGATEIPHISRPERKLHRTGHVRDFESDRDHQLAAERAAYQPLPEDQPEINHRGREKIEAALDEAFGKDRKIKAIEAEVEQRIPIDPDNRAKSLMDRERLLNALLRIHFDEKDS